MQENSGCIFRISPWIVTVAICVIFVTAPHERADGDLWTVGEVDFKKRDFLIVLFSDSLVARSSRGHAKRHPLLVSRRSSRHGEDAKGSKPKRQRRVEPCLEMKTEPRIATVARRKNLQIFALLHAPLKIILVVPIIKLSPSPRETNGYCAKLICSPSIST